MYWIFYIIFAFTLSALVTFFAMPALLRMCKRKGYFDMPDARKLHRNHTPRLGGTLFIPAMVIGIGGTFLLISIFKNTEQPVITLPGILAFIGLFILYLIGLLDDLFGMPAKLKFGVQLVVAVLLPFCGLFIRDLCGTFGITALPLWIALFLTVFISLLIVNAINLIDGIDGLAATLSLIALFAFTVLYYIQGILYISLFSASLAGTACVFLYYNLFGHISRNTKTFMGDTGSLTLGYALTFLAIRYIACGTTPVEGIAPEDYLLIPFTLFIVPCFDLVRVALWRLKNHKSIFNPDKTHIHHRCMQAGFSMRQSLALIVGLQLTFCAVNGALLWLCANPSFIIFVDIVVQIVFNRWISRRIVHLQNQ